MDRRSSVFHHPEQLVVGAYLGIEEKRKVGEKVEKTESKQLLLIPLPSLRIPVHVYKGSPRHKQHVHEVFGTGGGLAGSGRGRRSAIPQQKVKKPLHIKAVAYRRPVSLEEMWHTTCSISWPRCEGDQGRFDSSRMEERGRG